MKVHPSIQIGRIAMAAFCCLLLLLRFQAQAADRGQIESGETRAGNVVSGPPYLDTWSFTGNAGDRVVFYAVTTNGTFDTTLILYPPGGGAAEASGWTTGYGGDVLDHKLVLTGTYRLMIQDHGVNDTGTYNVTFLKIPGPVSSAADPDGGPITSGQTVGGQINVASDLDAFQISANVGERLIIYAVTTSGSLDTTIQLYPSGGGAAEASGWMTGYGGDSLEWQVHTTATYTIVIADHGLNSPGTYNLTVLKIPGPVNSAADPDGGPITSGQTVGGQINAASDLDAFQFYGQAGQRVLVHAVKSSGLLDTTILLYPPHSGPAEASGWMTGYGGDSLDWQLQKTGLYTIVIADHGLNDAGMYVLSFLQIPGPVNAPGDLDGGLARSGQTDPARINLPSDLDAFQFYGNVGDRVLIYAIKSSGTLDTTVALYPPGGGGAEATGWMTGYGGDSIDHQLQRGGLYTVVVADYGLSRTGDYTLSVTKIPGAATGIYTPSPFSGATIDGTVSAFRWDPVPGATGYDLYLAESGVNPLSKIGANLASPSLPIAPLQPEQIYYWQVVAHTPASDVYSPYWWFLVPRPTLRVARSDSQCVLSWPLWAGSFMPQATANLSPASWQTLPGVQTNSEQFVLEFPASAQSRFFRLKMP